MGSGEEIIQVNKLYFLRLPSGTPHRSMRNILNVITFDQVVAFLNLCGIYGFSVWCCHCINMNIAQKSSYGNFHSLYGNVKISGRTDGCLNCLTAIVTAYRRISMELLSALAMFGVECP